MEMSYLRSVCGVERMDKDSNETENGKCGMSSMDEGMSCGVVKVIKHGILK